jgi:hypothetical protein
MMKRKLLFGITFLFMAWAFTSCEALTDCEFCKLVTYENGVVITTGTESEYCGADLLARKTKPDVVIGDMTTKFVCR